MKPILSSQNTIEDFFRYIYYSSFNIQQNLECIMKKLSVLIIVLTAALSACQAEKAPEAAPEAPNKAGTVSNVTAIDSPAAVVATSTETKTTAVDTSEGENLHTENCSRCHGSDVYTRADRKVTSLDALGKQVRMCDSQLETQLFPEDMEKLTHYLNQTYYKF
jgi:mono/diheme cytochrome c family protein